MDKDVFPTPPDSGHANLLEHAASAYLRSARHQPVRWHPWGDEAFALAKSEDKPILLDIGAVWCHWCHVMDRESYENPRIAALINELFVAVKVDRDERPDVDARYQAAVARVELVEDRSSNLVDEGKCEFPAPAGKGFIVLDGGHGAGGGFQRFVAALAPDLG